MAAKKQPKAVAAAAAKPAPSTSLEAVHAIAPKVRADLKKMGIDSVKKYNALTTALFPSAAGRADSDITIAAALAIVHSNNLLNEALTGNVIYVVKFNSTWSIMVGVRFYRIIAMRSGDFLGTEVESSREVERVVVGGQEITLPESIKVTVKRKLGGNVIETKRTFWPRELVRNTPIWKSSPKLMAEKSAEAATLRIAFPDLKMPAAESPLTVVDAEAGLATEIYDDTGGVDPAPVPAAEAESGNPLDGVETVSEAEVVDMVAAGTSADGQETYAEAGEQAAAEADPGAEDWDKAVSEATATEDAAPAQTEAAEVEPEADEPPAEATATVEDFDDNSDF